MAQRNLVVGRFLLLAMFGISWTSVAMAQTNIHDQTFTSGTWSTGIFGGTNVSSFSLVRQVGVGFGGTDAQINSVSGTGSYTFDVFSLKTNGAFTPSSLLTVTQVSWSARVQSSSIVNFASYRLAAQQGDSLYVANASYFETPVFNSSWQATGGSLPISAFSKFFGSGTATPDTSSSGAPIKFGYFLSKGIFQTPQTNFGVSVFDVTISTTSTNAPEPSTVMFIVLGAVSTALSKFQRERRSRLNHP